jgi:hypothetical protein
MLIFIEEYAEARRVFVADLENRSKRSKRAVLSGFDGS